MRWTVEDAAGLKVQQPDWCGLDGLSHLGDGLQALRFLYGYCHRTRWILHRMTLGELYLMMFRVRSVKLIKKSPTAEWLDNLISTMPKKIAPSPNTTASSMQEVL